MGQTSGKKTSHSFFANWYAALTNGRCWGWDMGEGFFSFSCIGQDYGNYLSYSFLPVPNKNLDHCSLSLVGLSGLLQIRIECEKSCAKSCENGAAASDEEVQRTIRGERSFNMILQSVCSGSVLSVPDCPSSHWQTRQNGKRNYGA